ncbi:hypothetical protein NY547_03255 [Cnuibacter physcomitrellae]|uniref:hypothetical protein n=1 Tax=Cnuibacter physcomitrellae TaxID=1619308 RepID=UPI0021757E02|nr:hypothetical protein [Cnuibacter physcomitrellae]MCS5496256.1 hypothetical protein [Cnuibacter physcomitrellae]
MKRLPLLFHLASLGAAFALIMYLGRAQWFFYDEWLFISLRATDWITPHLGHWSTIPMLLTQGLVRTIGLDQYWPYLALAVLAHLVLAHLLWRAMNRLGVRPWLSTLMAAVFLFYGAGSENLFWAFQVGFVGAIALGALTLLLADRLTRENYLRWLAPLSLISIVSLMFAGTALAMIAGLAIIAFRRVGLWRAALLVAVPGAVYSVWYVWVKTHPIYFMPSDWQPRSLSELLLAVPLYALNMIQVALSSLTPVQYVGIVLGVALLVFAVVRFRRIWRDQPLAFAFAFAGIVFALLTGFSRLNLSFEASGSSRYIYFAFAMLVPLIAVGLDTVLRGRILAAVGATLLAGSIVWGVWGMRISADAQSRNELHTREVLFAAAAIREEHPDLVDEKAEPEPNYAPLFTLGELGELVDAGYLHIGPYDDEAYREAWHNIVEK